MPQVGFAFYSVRMLSDDPIEDSGLLGVLRARAEARPDGDFVFGCDCTLVPA